jgi:uncharacterized protein (TIGR02996 family)
MTMAARRSTASSWPGPQALAFLGDIIENPRDDARRLIFADWLQENDRPERAAFIRVQCELASLDEDDPRRPDLVQREQELLSAHRGAWVQEVPAWARQYARFHRGFIDEIHVTAAQWLKSGSKLREATPVERLTLRNAVELRTRVASSPLLAGLPALSVDHLGLDGVTALAGSPHVAGLEALELYRGGIGPEGTAVIAGSPNLTNLRELALESSVIRDAGVEALADSPHLTRLAILRLGNNNIGVPGARALAGSPTFANLIELNLTCCSPNIWGPDDGTRLGDYGVEMLCASPFSPRLRVLELRGQQITSAGAEALAAWPALGDLRVLNLQDNRISPDGVRALAASKYLGQLRSLDLGWNEIGDEGALALASSPLLANLMRLAVGRNDIHDGAARALLASPHLARLRWLDLDLNPVGREVFSERQARFGLRPPGG